MVLSVGVRFYGALNDFLPTARKQTTLACVLNSSSSVKDLVEALGVPHPEIDLIAVNGRPVDFACRLRDGDRVAVYPQFRAIDLGNDVRLGPPPQHDLRFVADVHLGRLAAYLRLAGFDTAYRNDLPDDEIVAVSVSEDRTVLTRDVGLLKHRAITRGYFVRETTPVRQLVEVMRRFEVAEPVAPFTRCLSCNTPLIEIAKNRVEHLLPARTREHFREFRQCPACDRIYWRGSHYAKMCRLLDAAFHGARFRSTSS